MLRAHARLKADMQSCGKSSRQVTEWMCEVRSSASLRMPGDPYARRRWVGFEGLGDAR
jgi:hypothetical protein